MLLQRKHVPDWDEQSTSDLILSDLSGYFLHLYSQRQIQLFGDLSLTDQNFPLDVFIRLASHKPGREIQTNLHHRGGGRV